MTRNLTEPMINSSPIRRLASSMPATVRFSPKLPAGRSWRAYVPTKLFFLTSRMWPLRLPDMDWPTIMDDIAVEIEELIRAMELDDREGLGLVARNHIFRSMTYLSQD